MHLLLLWVYLSLSAMSQKAKRIHQFHQIQNKKVDHIAMQKERNISLLTIKVICDFSCKTEMVFAVLLKLSETLKPAERLAHFR